MHMQSCHLAGQTYVIYQSGKNCGDAFFDHACFSFYQLRLLNSLEQCQLQLHAYCLLPGEIFLLATPLTPYAINSLMESVNSQYSQYFKLRFERDVEVWGNPIRSSLIQGNALIIDCQKYIERMPLECLQQSHPGTHEWSSYCANAFGIRHSNLSRHPGFDEFLTASEHPYRSYRDYIDRPFSQAYRDYLERKLKSGMAPAIRKQRLVKPIAEKRQLTA